MPTDQKVRGSNPFGLLLATHGNTTTKTTTASTTAPAIHTTIDKSVISATLDTLEVKGLVVRTPDPRDRRARRPKLTPRGRKICQRATLVTQKAEQELLGQLEPAQRDAFLDVLRYYAFSEFADAPGFTRDTRS